MKWDKKSEATKINYLEARQKAWPGKIFEIRCFEIEFSNILENTMPWQKQQRHIQALHLVPWLKPPEQKADEDVAHLDYHGMCLKKDCVRVRPPETLPFVRILFMMEHLGSLSGTDHAVMG